MKKTYWLVQNGDRFIVYARRPKKLEFNGLYVATNFNNDYITHLSSSFLPEVKDFNTLIKMKIDFSIEDK